MNSNNKVVTGLSLYMSNNMETLGDICALMMSEYPLADPLAHEKIVVMNLGMETFLSQRIAMQNNIVALCDYRQVWQIIYDTHRLLHPTAPKQDLFDREHITWNIFSQINLWSTQEPDPNKKFNIYFRLQQYLEDDSYGDKAYELSAKIADTLDQYQMYRPRWILAWNQIPLSAFDDYERDPDDMSNPINVFIQKECRRFVHEKSGFNEAKKRFASGSLQDVALSINLLEAQEDLESASQASSDGANAGAGAAADVAQLGQRVSKERVELIANLFRSNIWQIKLWCLLRYNLNLASSDDLGFNDPSSYDFVWLLEHLDRSQVMDSLIKELRTNEQLPKIYDRVFVFGVSALPRVVIEFLDALALHCSVNVMLLNPCSEYWADIAPRHRQDFNQYVKLIQASTKSIHERKLSTKKKFLAVPAQNLSINDYDDAGERIDGHPLLLSYGQQGRDNLYMFFDRDPVPDNIACFSEPDVEQEFVSTYENVLGQEIEQVSGGNLLAFLQKQLLNLAQHKSRYLITKDDRSFSIHSCHTKRREVEILHDAILECFNQAKAKAHAKAKALGLPESECAIDLYPRDIVVMVPAINDYAPHISAVFGGAYKQGSSDYIPYVISDRTESEANPICQALLMLLEIGSTRITSTLVINLLSEEAIGARFDLTKEDVAVIGSWLKDSNIYWGLDDEDTAEVAQINIPGTFGQGMDRMLLGSMLGDSELMPVFSEIEGFDAKTLGKFWDFLQALRELRAEFTPELSLSPSGWSERLTQKLTYRFFEDNFETDQALSTVYEVIENLKTIFSHIEHQPSINLAVFAATLRQGLTAVRNYQPFLKDKVNFCSLVPMRAVPFKHVFILGLNDIDFPREERAPGFNLMSSRDLFERGDRSRGIDDRYLFLEAILSARNSLYLSYIGQSPIDKSTLNPSIVLDELIYYICDNCTVPGHEQDSEGQRQVAVYERIVRKEHLNSYNLSNYVVDNQQECVDAMPSLPSFNRRFILLNNETKRPSSILGSGIFYSDMTGNLSQELSLASLFAFLKNPSRTFLKKVLKIDLAHEEQEVLPDDEVFDLDRGEINKYVSELINLPADKRELYLERLALLGKIPYGIFSTNLMARLTEKSQDILTVLHDNFGLETYGQVSKLDCDNRTFKVYIPKNYYVESTYLDVLNLAKDHQCGRVAASEEHYCFEVVLKAQARSRPLCVSPFSSVKTPLTKEVKPKANSNKAPIYYQDGELLTLHDNHFVNCKLLFDLLEEAIAQYLYNGALLEITDVASTGKLCALEPFEKEELETVIYFLLIYYLLGLGSPMPIMKDALTKLAFNESGELIIKEDNQSEATFTYDEDSAFLYKDLLAIVQNQRLSLLAGSFFDFYARTLAPKLYDPTAAKK